MEGKRNSLFQAMVMLMLWLTTLLSVSCQQQSYTDLLTGGDVKCWKYVKYTSYITFNKKTQRALEYDENLKVSYMNAQDWISKGQFFRIKGNTIFRSWILDQDTFPVDTITIVSISSKRLALRFYKDGGVVELIHYPMKKKK